eukprot:289004-Ditylum_brightwellii.AAC.1
MSIHFRMEKVFHVKCLTLNKLVDGGIATAPEIAQYNDNFGWGVGIETMGVTPDVSVDNDPRDAYDGKDEQLKKAIETLKD